LSNEYLAINAMHKQEPTIKDDGSMAMVGMIEKASILLPHIILFKAALFGQPEPPVWVKIVKGKPSAKARGKHGASGDFSEVKQFLNDSTAVQFVLYYEQFADWVKAQAGCDIGKLHPVWGFGRVVRNAIGHAGVVSINDQNFKPVKWEGLTYGPAQNGRAIIGPDLHAPDLILLMLDMDRALDQMGYA
jgi:hypothetical protein